MSINPYKWSLRQTKIVIVAAIALALGSAAFAQGYSGVVVFGDSLSDPGNHFIAFGTSATAPFAPSPDASYDVGGHHFSDGATWAEQFAEALHLPVSGNPALKLPGVYTNYAVGRARAREAQVVPGHDLSDQVTAFLNDFNQQASSTNLYAIWIGANDLDDALTTLVTNPTGGLATSTAILNGAIASTAANIETLWYHGARTFLILTVANPANTPLLRSLGAQVQGAATSLDTAYNAGLATAMTQLSGLQGIRFITVDTNAVFAKLLTLPVFSDVSDSCLTFGVVSGAVCARPDRYLFWDGIHPTAAAHGYVALAALQALILQR